MNFCSFITLNYLGNAEEWMGMGMEEEEEEEEEMEAHNEEEEPITHQDHNATEGQMQMLGKKLFSE